MVFHYIYLFHKRTLIEVNPFLLQSLFDFPCFFSSFWRWNTEFFRESIHGTSKSGRRSSWSESFRSSDTRSGFLSGLWCSFRYDADRLSVWFSKSARSHYHIDFSQMIGYNDIRLILFADPEAYRHGHRPAIRCRLGLAVLVAKSQ